MRASRKNNTPENDERYVSHGIYSTLGPTRKLRHQHLSCQKILEIASVWPQMQIL